MDIEELDADKLAELETLLYCQVFHSKETEDCQSTNTITMEDNANVKTNRPSTKPRYFEKQNKKKKNSERSWYPKSPEKMKQQQNNPDATSPIQNNITINHYVYNVPGWTYGSDKEESLEVVNKLKKKLTNRKRPHKKKREEIKKKISEKIREQRKNARKHVIFISDDESSDGCQIVSENGGSINSIHNSNSISAVSSNDEEVLFVPSEPCETIDLDSEDESAGNKMNEQNVVTDESSSQNVEANNDSEENNGQEEGEFDIGFQKLSKESPKLIKKVTSNESHESNDFLDSGVVQDSQDFDFNLHGSEFNQCSAGGVLASPSEQFVKPPNPSGDTPTADNHETESESTSSTTTGTDRACSNEFSLKNIVFQEVDFPKADIFADNDLHSFEKLITPQRGDQDSGEEVQEERVNQEARSSRMSKTSMTKAVHTPPPGTPASVKARKGGWSAKSSKKHAMRTKQGEEKNEGRSEDSESSSESEFESNEGQQRWLPELSLMSQPNTPDIKQKRQGSSEAGEGVQEQRVAKEARTSRMSKTSTSKAAHTPPLRTPTSVKARKGGLSTKSPGKRAMRTKQGEEENESRGSEDSEESSSASEFESGEGQQGRLSELSLMSQSNTPDRKQKEQESSNADEGVQEQRVAEEARTSRMSKTGMPGAVHTPPPRTPVGMKARKGGSSTKSLEKHAMQTEQGDEENEGLPEQSLMSQPNTPDINQKEQESSNVDEGVQEQRVAKEARTSRMNKTSTPKAVHTPSPRTPANVKARKGVSSAKSSEKHAMQTEQEEEENETLPELILMSQPNTPDSMQKEQESSNVDVGTVNIDLPEVNESVSSVDDEAVVVENPTGEESSTTSVDTGVSWKRGDKNGKAKNKKSRVTKQQSGAQNRISRKRKMCRRGPQRATPSQQQIVPVESPISLKSSSNDADGSDDDVELIEKPIEVIPVEDSDEDVEDIRLGVEEPLDEAQGDDVHFNVVEKMPDKPVGDASNDLDLVYANLTSDPSKWQISRKDKPYYVALEQRQRSKGARCNRCRRFGHTALRCTEKPEPPRCYLCSAEDHTEPRCPNKICLNCGNEGDYTTNYCYRCFKYRDLQCRLCSQPGHLAAGCPDLWRRYHITTEPGPIKVPVGPQLKPRHDQWCSGCASQGHLEHECNYYGRQYPPSLPYIINYDNVLFPDQPQQSVLLTQNTPKNSINSDVVNDAAQTIDTSGKRAPKHKTPNEQLKKIGNSSNEIGHPPQKRSKCKNKAQMVQTATTQQKQPEEASRNKDLPTESIQSLGEPVNMLPQNRLFNLAGYRLQPRAVSDMRLFDIAGYGIPSAGVNEPSLNHNGVNPPDSVWSRLGMNENINGPPITPATIPSLLSLQFQPRFDIGGFDRLPTGEELRWLENHNLGGEQEEMVYQDEDAIDNRLGPGHNQEIKDYFMRAPIADLKTFVSSELRNLVKVRKTDIGGLKKQISLAVTQHRTMQRNVNHSNKEIRREMRSKALYRRANMFLFGVRQLQYGNRHLAALKRMAAEGKGRGHISLKQRMSFYIAYDYVFGDELKRGVNYPSLLGKLLNRKKRKQQKQQQVSHQQ